MRIVVLKQGSVVVRHGDQEFLFGVPKGTRQALKEVGIEVPNIVFTTNMRAPGYGELGKSVIHFKEQAFVGNGISITPIDKKHGTDFAILSDDGSFYFSERGDVAASDIRDYTLSVIKNQHPCKAMKGTVVQWPWFDAEYLLKDNVLTEVTTESYIALKVWSSMEDVPDNLKTLDNAPLSLDQANFIARVAAASGEGEKENYAIAISSFKKTHKKEGDKWVKEAKDEKASKKEATGDSEERDKGLKEMGGYGQPVRRLGEIFVSRIHKAYNDEADKWLQNGWVNQDERIAIAGAIGKGLKALNKAFPEDVSNRTHPDDRIPSALKELAPDVPNELEDGYWCSVYKSDNGIVRWVSISSVAVWDKQNELFTTKAMDWAIAVAKLTENYGPLRYKHFPGIDGGECDTMVRVGDFLFESGFFYDNPFGLAMRDKLKNEPDDWQISVGLAYGPDDIIDGEYEKAAIFERSMTKVPANPMAVIS